MITDTFHTVDVYRVSDILSQNGDVNYYDVLTLEFTEDISHKTYYVDKSVCVEV